MVYDDDNVVKAAFIVKSYLTEDPTGNNKPGKPSNDKLGVKIFTSGPNKYHFAFLNAEGCHCYGHGGICWSTPSKSWAMRLSRSIAAARGITKVDVKRGNSGTTFYAMSYTVTDEGAGRCG